MIRHEYSFIYWQILSRRLAWRENPRVEFDGAFYHVIARGNQRQRILRTTATASFIWSIRKRYGFAKELGRGSIEDPSMISRLDDWYEAHPDKRTEKSLASRAR